MKSYNKNNLINIWVVALIALTAFFLIASFTVLGGKYWGLLVLPTVAAGYGCYAFYKKYHIADIYKDEPKK